MCVLQMFAGLREHPPVSFELRSFSFLCILAMVNGIGFFIVVVS